VEGKSSDDFDIRPNFNLSPNSISAAWALLNGKNGIDAELKLGVGW
jgi:hypothetical protein